MNLDYVAGLFDGEGWFQIDRSPRRGVRRGYAYQLHARISLRQRFLLQQLRTAFGGSLRCAAEATEKRAAYWSWDVCGVNALRFASRIQDRLVLKRAHAKLAVRFQTLKAENKNGPCSDARWRRYTAMYERMKRLNKRGPR